MNIGDKVKVIVNGRLCVHPKLIGQVGRLVFAPLPKERSRVHRGPELHSKGGGYDNGKRPVKFQQPRKWLAQFGNTLRAFRSEDLEAA